MLSAGVVLLHGTHGAMVIHLLQEFSCEVFNSYILNPGPRAQRFPFFLTPQEIPIRSASAFVEWQRGGDDCHTVVPIPGGRLLRHRDTKVGLTAWQMSVFQCSPNYTITRLVFRTRQIDGVQCGRFSIHAPLGETTLRVGRVWDDVREKMKPAAGS